MAITDKGPIAADAEPPSAPIPAKPAAPAWIAEAILVALVALVARVSCGGESAWRIADAFLAAERTIAAGDSKEE